MPTEVALLESPALGVEQMGRVEVLDKVKSLVMLPDGIHLRTEDVARYFEVSTTSVRRLTDRHQEEPASNGMKVLRGSELQSFHSDILSLWKGGGVESYPQAATQLRLHTRRTVLNIAMLLRDSDIARSVRTYLLDAEDDLRSTYVSLDRRVTRIEGCLAGVGSALQELGPVLGRMSQRLDSLDRKLDVTHQVIGAMSLRLTDVSQDVIRLDARMDDLAHGLRDLSRRTSG
uniref:Phage protein n=1 Tax=Streptomyces sp. NBC_01401 TaxID=2903854 RepID=A0AAU3GWW4_9ACTN